MASVDPSRLGQILMEQGILSAVQLKDALEEQRVTGRFLGEILVSRGVASEEQIAKSLSEQLGFAFVDLREMTIEPKALELIPRDLCVKFTVIPLFVSQNTLTVAMANALDVQVVDKIQSSSGLRVRPVFACPSVIRGVLEKFTEKKGEPANNMERESVNRAPNLADPSVGANLKEAASLTSVINKVNRLIEKAVEMGASDIHLEPERDKFICRYRIDGILHSMPQIPAEEQAEVVSRIKIMADIDIAERRLPQDGRFRMFTAGRDVDLRISTFPALYGENVVIRILDRSGGLLKLADLGFSEENLSAFIRLIRRPYGMLLVTGPTGSGKTTTLYSALSEINSVEKNIITLEDPVEYELSNIRQSQINVKAGLTFAAGLRSIVRQDPDIIMIGEIRDRETADIAIHAALTGHLVFSTLHTNDAPSAAARLIDMGVEPFLVASSVIGILAQRLMRTLCPSCKEEYTPPQELLAQLGLSEKSNKSPRKILPEASAKVKNFFKEVGCNKCKQYGYLGRTAIFEFLIPNERVKELIARKSSAQTISEEAVKSGMRTLREAGLEKVIDGVTSVSELLRVTEEV